MGRVAPLARMRSRKSGLSPYIENEHAKNVKPCNNYTTRRSFIIVTAMLPRAHAHCSCTAALLDRRSCTRQGAVASAAWAPKILRSQRTSASLSVPRTAPISTPHCSP